MITGASSGIGLEMARLMARQKFNLILVARNIDKLNELKHQLNDRYGVEVHSMQADLSVPENAIKLHNQVNSLSLQVSMLVNNAGFGEYGDFTDIPLDKQVDMINVNITSLMILCRLFLKDMKQAGRGKVLNVASLLSYLPFPYYAVYSATKAFVLAFTETIAAELEGTGVEAKALCPGPVDTSFTTPEMLNTNAYKSNKPISAVRVAEVGIRHLLHGTGSKKVGFKTWFISNLPRVTPDAVMIRIKKKLASQR